MAKGPAYQHSSDRPPIVWDDFPFMADSWFAAYATLPHQLMPVVLFSLAHAVELYLKGCHARYLGTIEETVRLGHNLPKVWKLLKDFDATFMPAYEIRQNVYDLALAKSDEDIQSSLPPNDWAHYREHREFYMVVKYVADLKYLGGPMKIEMHPYIYHTQRNPYWVWFFKAMRAFIFRGMPVYCDKLATILDFGGFTPEQVEYMKGVGVLTYEQVALHEMSAEERAANAAVVEAQGRGLLMDSFSVMVNRPIPREPE